MPIIHPGMVRGEQHLGGGGRGEYRIFTEWGRKTTFFISETMSSTYDSVRKTEHIMNSRTTFSLFGSVLFGPCMVLRYLCVYKHILKTFDRMNGNVKKFLILSF